MVNRWAVVIDGSVDNVAVWDGESEWDTGEAVLVPLADDDTVGVGWTYDGSTFTPGDGLTVNAGVAVTVDPAVIADLVAQAQKASTVAATRSVLTALLEQLTQGQ